jgi:hypothetical protein
VGVEGKRGMVFWVLDDDILRVLHENCDICIIRLISLCFCLFLVLGLMEGVNLRWFCDDFMLSGSSAYLHTSMRMIKFMTGLA